MDLWSGPCIEWFEPKWLKSLGCVALDLWPGGLMSLGTRVRRAASPRAAQAIEGTGGLGGRRAIVVVSVS